MDESVCLDYTRPPLGAAPAYVRCNERIKELADAISRISKHGEHYPGHIEMWAHEIIAQANIMKEMDHYRYHLDNNGEMERV